jgi:hypothetical protein
MDELDNTGEQKISVFESNDRFRIKYFKGRIALEHCLNNGFFIFSNFSEANEAAKLILQITEGNKDEVSKPKS